MENTLQYKGYFANVNYSAEDMVLYGKIEGIVDLVTFESESAADIEKEFHNAVDDYLAFCEEVGKEPNKTYKGSFNVRIDPRLHRDLSLYALKNDISLNRAVERAIAKLVLDEDRAENIFIDSINGQLSKIWGTLSQFSASSQIIQAQPNMTYMTFGVPNSTFNTKGVPV